jgi:BNR repeat-like domain
MRTATRALLSAAILLATAALPATAAAKPYKVDLTQVSGPSPFAAGCPGAAFDSTMITGQELEPTIAANPRDRRNIIGTWKQDVGPDSTRADLIASTRDGGRTWSRSTIPGLSKCTGGTADGGSDPWVSVGGDGTAYFSGLAPTFADPPDPGDPPSAVVASTSRDRGRTWTVPATLAPLAAGNEMPAVTANPKRRGEAYTVWAEFATAAIKFARTTDGGATWSEPVVIDPAIPDSLDLVPRLVVLPSGALLTIFDRAEFAIGVGKVYSSRSLDGGATWTEPVELLATPFAKFFDENGEELPQPQFPNIAVARDGTVYVTVEAVTSATAGTIAVARSRDGGRNWTRTTSPGVGAYGFEPAVAVDRHGTVGITWYDLRNDRLGDGPLTGDMWFASSDDRGNSWREVHVAGPTDLRTGALARQNRFGEYQGLTATGDRRFAAIFALAAPFATDGPTDIFVARIERRGR